MIEPLRVLIVEDMPTDVELAQREIKKSFNKSEFFQVDAREEYLSALKNFCPDIIISDYRMPRFDGLEALKLAIEHVPLVPVIILTSAINEDTAVECMKAGAADYVIKEHSKRLGQAMVRALEESQIRKARHHAEEALRESEERYRLLFYSSPEAIILLGVDGKLIDVNAAAVKYSGIPREKLLGMSFTDLDILKNDYSDLMMQTFTAVCQGEGPQQLAITINRPDGMVLWMECLISALKKGDSIYAIQVIANDVSERKMNEARLLQSEQQFRLISENVSDLIILTDHEGQLTYVSPSYKQILGEINHPVATNWFEYVYPDDRQKVYDALHTVVLSENNIRLDFRIIGKQSAVRYIESQSNAIKNTDGLVTNVVTVCRDVTEQRNLEQQFLRTQRLESLGTLAGGVAHDLNNVLAPIMMGIASLDPHTDEKGKKTLAMLESSAARGAEIVKQILGFARGMEGERIVLQPKHLLKEMLSIAQATFPKNIELHSEIESHIWPLVGDATQIQQLLMNLCVNARDAMPNGGIITLTATNKMIDEQYAHMNINAKPGAYVMLGVQDTGVGMPSSVLDRIFEPFFTTKEVGKGTGLGLSTVHSIVKSHKGFINVHSEVGKGTAFEVYLPAAEQHETLVVQTPSIEQVHGHGEVILVVDDEPSVLQITKQTLEMHGYSVLTANEGTEAVAIYASRKHDIDLVITDMIMPIMDGVRTIQALRTLNPDVKIITSSGFTNTDQYGKVDDLHIAGVLLKPYTADVLLKKIKEVLTQ